MNEFVDLEDQNARVGQRGLAAKNISGHNLQQNAISTGSGATPNNTFGTLVQRDANGNFSATTVTANLTGKASQNENPLSFTLPIQRLGNIVSLTYTPANKAGDTISGDMTFQGNVLLSTLGKSLRIKEGVNACMGVAVLVGGTVTVSTSAVTATSRIFLSVQTAGGTQGFLSISARAVGTSFTILSTNVLDTSTVAWIIVEPA